MKKLKIIIGVLLAVCLIMFALPVMASDGSTEVKGTVPLLINNVSSSGISDSSATLTWDTNGPSSSQVFYDTTSRSNIGDYLYQTPIDNTPVSTHTVPLTGLTPNKTYYYRVESTAAIGGTAISEEYSFMTLARLTMITVAANPNPVTQTDITSSSTITVTALDQNNNPMPNIVLDLTASSPGSITPMQVTTAGTSGQATATLTLSSLITQPTTVTVTATSGIVQGQTSVTFNPVASKLPTMTIIYNVSPEPSAYGQSVTINVIVLSNWFRGVPSGTVNFMDGTTLLGASTVGQLGFTSFSISTLAVGKHTITAVYLGDNTFAGDTSNTWTHNVNKANTTTDLLSSSNPSVIGQTVTFTAKVSPSAATGSVTFKDGNTILSSNVPLVGGSAAINVSTLTIGSHNITATYSGDGNYNSSNDAVTQKVNKASTAMVLSSNLNPSTYGKSVNFTATITPNTAAGSVTFKDGNTTLGTGTLSGGTATFTTTALSVGTHNITAVYGGNSNYAASTSITVVQTVVAKPVIKTTSLPSGKKGSTYSQTLLVSGGLAPFTWSITGSLPAGLSLNPSTGVISGKPTATGTFNFTAKVTDSLGNTATQGLSIKINN